MTWYMVILQNDHRNKISFHIYYLAELPLCVCVQEENIRTLVYGYFYLKWKFTQGFIIKIIQIEAGGLTSDKVKLKIILLIVFTL